LALDAEAGEDVLGARLLVSDEIDVRVAGPAVDPHERRVDLRTVVLEVGRDLLRGEHLVDRGPPVDPPLAMVVPGDALAIDRAPDFVRDRARLVVGGGVPREARRPPRLRRYDGGARR